MSESTIKLEGAMTIAKAETLSTELEAIYRDSSPVVFDASEVSRVDTAILQLLVSFINSMKANGLTVAWGAVSEEFMAGSKLLGLEQDLGL